MSHGNKVYIGNTTQWGENTPCSLSVSDRMHHIHTMGQTGVGKSTLLRNMILQDICLGHGVGVIDPHGELGAQMPNLNTVLKEEITRLARKEIKKGLGAAKKQKAQHRKDIAALKREVSELQRQVAYLEKQEQRRLQEAPRLAEVKEEVRLALSSVKSDSGTGGRTGPRFQARGLRSHRDKLGLSAADYGKLVGVSSLTIYNWEKEKSKPRNAQLEKLREVRGIGQREALRRLELL